MKSFVDLFDCFEISKELRGRTVKSKIFSQSRKREKEKKKKEELFMKGPQNSPDGHEDVNLKG